MKRGRTRAQLVQESARGVDVRASCTWLAPPDLRCHVQRRARDAIGRAHPGQLPLHLTELFELLACPFGRSADAHLLHLGGYGATVVRARHTRDIGGRGGLLGLCTSRLRVRLSWGGGGVQWALTSDAHSPYRRTPQLDDPDVEHPRYHEIRAWLNRNPGIAAWAALDDSIAQFPEDKRERAVFTDPATGLDADAISALRALLAQAR